MNWAELALVIALLDLVFIVGLGVFSYLNRRLFLGTIDHLKDILNKHINANDKDFTGLLAETKDLHDDVRAVLKSVEGKMQENNQ